MCAHAKDRLYMYRHNVCKCRCRLENSLSFLDVERVMLRIMEEELPMNSTKFGRRTDRFRGDKLRKLATPKLPRERA